MRGRWQVGHYSLDVIISVGYRVNSLPKTRFCPWTTDALREYFSLNEHRLAQRGLRGLG